LTAPHKQRADLLSCSNSCCSK